MNHADVHRHMASYLEGDLPLGERALVDAHLDECGACSQEIAEMRDLIGLLHSLPDPEVPQHLASNVMRRIRAGEGHRTWLDELRAGIELVLAPRVLAPLSAAMLAAGILLASGQGRVLLPGAESRPIQGQVRTNLDRGAGGPVLARAATERELAGAHAAQGPGVRGSALAADGRASEAGLPMGPSGGQLHELLLLTDIVLQASEAPYPSVASYGAAAGPAASESRSPSVLSTPSGVVQVSRRSGEAPVERAAPGFANSLTMPAAAHQSARPGSPERELPSSDEWLAILQRNPAAFAEQLATQTLAEHELWVENLARRAVAHGSFDDVVAALRASSSERARILAEDFAAAGQRARRSLESGHGGSSGAPD